jgi:hypothetical protein
MGYTITKGNYQSFFSEYITLSVNFSVGPIGGTTNIQTIFDLVPRFLKHVWCHRSHSVPYAGFQCLRPLVSVLHITPQEKNPVGLNLAT